MPRTIAVPLSLALVLAIATPAFATPFCVIGSKSGIGAEIIIGEKMNEEEKMDFAIMALRKVGVDATRVETWNGCLRAWVRNGHGGEDMVFFDPDTLERVY